MKRYSILVIVSLLVLCTASASYAIFPGRNGLPFPNAVGDGTLSIQLMHGWAQSTDAWYHCFSTNNIRLAQTDHLTLSPLLSSAALPGGASTMFVITNFNNQGPVFSGTPIGGAYSSVWQVFYVRWRPGVVPWVVKNPFIFGVPPGLPLAGVQADYSLSAPGAPPASANAPTIVDCTIFALGQISNPWRKPTSFVPPIVYRIPQGISLNTYTKQLTIPYWNVYCQDPTTKAIHVERVVIPDASLPVLASLIGANFAPVLVGFSQADKGLFSVMNWAQDINPILPGIQPLKVLANQYPIICACPEPCGWRNTNDDYSPITQFALLNRTNLAFAEVLVQTCSFIDAQEPGNLLSVLFPTFPLPVPPTPVGWPPVGVVPQLYNLHSPVVCNDLNNAHF